MTHILNTITTALLSAPLVLALYPQPQPIILEYHHINDVCAPDDLGLIRLTVEDVIELI